MSHEADAPSSTSGTVLIPAGPPLEEAAAWVGQVCWTELRFHEVLTAWLAVEADPELSQALWAIRSHRAELAEQWHRRLPELREFPRHGFVVPSGDAVVGTFAEAEALVDDAGSADRRAAAVAILSALGHGYRSRLDIAVGPADGPTAASLARAIEVTDADLARLEVITTGAVPTVP